ncbi:MAG: hypothetical protein ACYCQI_14445 [Gammaproteobacteria bacterium]
MFCSRGLFRPPSPQGETFLPPEIEAKILVEKEPPEDPNKFDLEKHYKAVNHYEKLIDLRYALCQYQSKLKSSAPPTSYRTVNWLISFTGTPVNQGDAADAVKIIDQALSTFNKKRGESFAAESVPVALKNLLALYKLIVAKGQVSDAIDKTFYAFFHIKAKDIDEAQLDELIKKIYPSGVSMAP